MSAFTIQNQIPTALNPNYAAFEKLKNQGDPADLLKKAIADQILNKGASITAHSKTQTKSVDSDAIADLLIKCLDEKIDPTNEKLAKELLSQTVLNYQASPFLPVRLLYAQISGTQYKLPIPTPSLIYTESTDIIPACKNYLANTASSEYVFATFAYTYKPKTLAFGFRNANTFEKFKTWLQPKISLSSKSIPAETVTKFNDLMKEKLNNLTLNLQLKSQDTDDQDPYSFSRMFINMLQTYAKSNRDCFIMPFDLGENFNPRSLILVNIESHAHAPAASIKRTWVDIKNTTSAKISILSNTHLQHLPSLARQKKTLKHQMQNMAKAVSQQKQKYRQQFTGFSTKKPTTVQLTNKIIKILKHMSDVNSSSNIYKQVKRSFNKPNRRHPDDFNLPGKIVSTSYKPDLHIYLDTSGSISEENYEAGIKACIYLAKKLNINLYFNSFSHYLSQCIKMPLAGRSAKQSYAYFQKIPKAMGGTDFLNIYKYIQASKKRRKELSILITDFGDRVPNEDFVFPKNLYMMAIDYYNFDTIRTYATKYAQEAIASGHFEIPDHILL